MKACGPYMAMVLIQLVYGGANVFTKVSLERGLNPLVFILYRHLIAMLVLSPFAYVLERKQRPSIIKASTMAKIFLLSLFGITAHLNLYYAGLRYTSPTVASALGNIIPSLTIVLAVILRMENVQLASSSGKAKVLGTVICIIGSLIFTFWKGKNIFNDGNSSNKRPAILLVEQHNNWIKGALLIIISCASWSMWLILHAVVYKVYPARLSLNVWICFFACLQTSVLAVFWGRNPDIWKVGWNVELWTILYCGFMISGLVYYLQIWCISKKGPVFAAMFTPLLVVVIGLVSAVAFGERLHLGSLIGAVILIVGLYCVLWGKRAETQTPEKSTNTTRSNLHEQDREDKKTLDIPTAARV